MLLEINMDTKEFQQRLISLEDKVDKLMSMLWGFGASGALIGLLLTGYIYLGNEWRQSREDNETKIFTQIYAIDTRLIKVEDLVANFKPRQL